MHLNQTPIVTSTILFLSLLLSKKLLLQCFYNLQIMILFDDSLNMIIAMISLSI